MSELPRLHAQHVTDILVQAGVVTPPQIDAALERQQETGRRIGETLVEMGAASEEDIGWALARQFGIPFVDVVPDSVDLDLVRGFSEDLLRRAVALPLVRGGDGISMAISDPTHAEVLDLLQDAAGRPLVLCMATRTAIEGVFETVFGRSEAYPRRGDVARRPEVIGDRFGTGFLQLHVTQALAAGASELCFIPGDGHLRVDHRIGGRLTTAAMVRSHVLYGLLARIEALGGPVIDGGGDHASGRVRCPLGDRDAVLDVSLLSCDQGIAVTLGLHRPDAVVPTLETSGIDPVDVARLRDILHGAAGLLLVAGPPRSLCSATLAALLGATPCQTRMSLAIERVGGQALDATIRIALDRARARAVWEEIAVGQSADVIALDDILTGGAVSGVLSPAGAGRLLLATTDWTDSFDLLDELLVRRQARSVLASRLQAVVQQRLVRRAAAAGSGDGAAADVIAEVLIINDAMRDALRVGAGAAELRGMALADGFVDLARRVQARLDAEILSADEAARLLT